MKLDDQIKLLDAEIKWCIEHPDDAFHKEYRKGFVNGLIQAKYLLTSAVRVTRPGYEHMTRPPGGSHDAHAKR